MKEQVSVELTQVIAVSCAVCTDLWLVSCRVTAYVECWQNWKWIGKSGVNWPDLLLHLVHNWLT